MPKQQPCPAAVYGMLKGVRRRLGLDEWEDGIVSGKSPEGEIPVGQWHLIHMAWRTANISAQARTRFAQNQMPQASVPKPFTPSSGKADIPFDHAAMQAALENLGIFEESEDY